MIETLHLKKPLNTLSGGVVTDLKFDFEALTPIDYRNIIRLETKLKGAAPLDGSDFSIIKATSAEFRIATAWIAAVNCAENGICFDDYERLCLSDFLQLEQIGLFFITDVE